MTPAEALLQEIRSINGKLSISSDGEILCEQVPRSYEPQLVALQEEIFSLLRLAEPPPPLDKKQLRKLIKTVQDAGGEFHLSTSGRFFDYIKLPDSVLFLKPQIFANLEQLFQLKFPTPRKSSSKPRKVQCIVCKPGTGCRTSRLAYFDRFLPCPRCEHPCYLHFEGTHQQLADGGRWDTPDGCNHWEQIDDETCEKVKCDCIGWPFPLAQPKAGRSKRSATQLLLPAVEQEDAEESED
jgi:hypothetical protein